MFLLYRLLLYKDTHENERDSEKEEVMLS